MPNGYGRGGVPPDMGARFGARTGVAASASPGEDRANMGRIVTVQPWWLYPYKGSQDFNQFFAGAALAAGASSVPGELTIDINVGFQAVVRFVTLFINAPDTTALVSAQLLINGGPVPGWKVASFPRVANNLSITKDGYVRVPPNALVSLRLVNDSPGAFVVGGEFGGWQTQQDEIERLNADY